MDNKTPILTKKLFIGNWKSNKSKKNVIEFFEYVKTHIKNVDLANKKIIIAPPFTLLAKCKYFIEKYDLPISLCAQNVSSFPQGAYTGEISAKQVKEFADYVIIGHSERRKYLRENESDIENKVREAREAGLMIIQCVQDENTTIYKGVSAVAYEPISAIGTGNPDDPKHISEVFETITRESNTPVLYGGSVVSSNIKQFLKIPNLSGFLVGGASIQAESFLSLLND